MGLPYTAKPATDTRKPASNEQLGGQLDTNINLTLTDIQARRLTRRFALAVPVAIVIASLHYGEGAR